MKHCLVVLLVSVFSLSALAQEIHSGHHIELSVSEPLSSMWRINMPWTPNIYRSFDEWNSKCDYISYNWNKSEFRIPPITLGYYYQVLDWLQVGAEVGTYVSGIKYSVVNTYFLESNLYMAAGVRFNYYHKNITDLYSGLTIGANVRMASTESNKIISTDAVCAWQLTALGVRFGKRVYGTVEVGYGYKGLLSIGIGTHF